MNAEIAEKLKYFNFSSLLLQNRATEDSIVHALGSSFRDHTETAAANISLTINVAGNADRKEVEAAGQTLLDRFGELMRQYQRREARTAF